MGFRHGTSCRRKLLTVFILATLGFVAIYVVLLTVFSIFKIDTGRSAILSAVFHYYLNQSEHHEGFSLRDVNLSTTKLILLGTTFFTDPKWENFFKELPATLSYASGKQCLLATEAHLNVGKADAVVFHGPDIDFDSVPHDERQDWQRWVYFSLEAPINLHLHERYVRRQINRINFNWTMSYSRKNDVFYPYGRFQPLSRDVSRTKINESIAKFQKNFKERPHDAVWIVSNCHSFSSREMLAWRLQKLGLDVDILGSCGDKPFNASISYIDLSEYRFYFAFENVFCDDYITEKAFQALDAACTSGLVPVVFGGAPYSEFLPANSYIDATSFNDVKELFGYLKNFSAEDVRQHLSWQLNYQLDYDRNFATRHYISTFGWDALCEKLWTSDEQSYVPDVSKNFGKCFKNLTRGYFKMSMEQILEFNIDFVKDVIAAFKTDDGTSSDQDIIDLHELAMELARAEKKDDEKYIQILRNLI